ncbi:3'-5' exonuclease [Herbaspirillum camelliae]|uniref:3'-5' exonuclease n=1 Tax=Herbaspirillum camelliae TaxID=1892903 RepID=UPI000949DDAE|nr:3'-5' exonuclease [Herbaspirillum camelliae]
MKYLVVDLEATCSDDGSITAENMEIIEIGACWASPSGEVLQRFQQFVKPLVNPALTPFCRALTGISQHDVDTAPLFATAAEKLFLFAEEHSDPQAVWMSWGAYDQKQLVRDSSLHQVKFPIAFPHQNAKKMFAKNQKIGKEVGMAKACELAGFSLLGQHHRGLDDAVNIARLLPFILGHSHLRKSKNPAI